MRSGAFAFCIVFPAAAAPAQAPQSDALVELPPWALATGFGSLALLLGVRFFVKRRGDAHR